MSDMYLILHCLVSSCVAVLCALALRCAWRWIVWAKEIEEQMEARTEHCKVLASLISDIYRQQSALASVLSRLGQSALTDAMVGGFDFASELKAQEARANFRPHYDDVLKRFAE